MKSLRRGNSIFLISYIAASAFCITFSIAGYGFNIFLLFLLLMQFVYDSLNGKTKQLSGIDIRLYFAYIIIFYICSLFNGDGDSDRNSLILNYLLCIFIYIAISKNVTNRIIIRKISNALLVLMLLDCTITLLQYYNIPLGWAIWYLFNDVHSEEQTNFIVSLGTGSQTMGNLIFCPGIFPSIVYNAYVIAALSPIALYKLYNARNLRKKILYTFAFLLITYSLVVIQQRIAFFLFLVAFATMLFSKNKKFTIIVAILLIFTYLIFGFNIDEKQIGRLVDLEDRTRENIYSSGFDYILEHLLVGGRNEFAEANRFSAHNVFLNAFMYGGLFGAMLIITIYVRMCVSSIKVIIKSMKIGITETVVFAYGLLIFNLISLVHNNSLLTGDSIIWVLYAIMLLSLKFEEYDRRL